MKPGLVIYYESIVLLLPQPHGLDGVLPQQQQRQRGEAVVAQAS